MIEAKCSICGYTVACRYLPKGYISELEWAGDKLSEHSHGMHPRRRQLEVIETAPGSYTNVYKKDNQHVAGFECTLCGYSETEDTYPMHTLPTDLDGDMSWGEIVLRRHIAVSHPDILEKHFEFKQLGDTVKVYLANRCEEKKLDAREFDPVLKPEHYAIGKIECIDWITLMLDERELRGYLKGNMLKYLWRHEHKGKCEEDLRKCIWYAERLLSLGVPKDIQ